MQISLQGEAADTLFCSEIWCDRDAQTLCMNTEGVKKAWAAASPELGGPTSVLRLWFLNSWLRAWHIVGTEMFTE